MDNIRILTNKKLISKKLYYFLLYLSEFSVLSAVIYSLVTFGQYGSLVSFFFFIFLGPLTIAGIAFYMFFIAKFLASLMRKNDRKYFVIFSILIILSGIIIDFIVFMSRRFSGPPPSGFVY